MDGAQESSVQTALKYFSKCQGSFVNTVLILFINGLKRREAPLSFTYTLKQLICSGGNVFIMHTHCLSLYFHIYESQKASYRIWPEKQKLLSCAEHKMVEKELPYAAHISSSISYHICRFLLLPYAVAGTWRVHWPLFYTWSHPSFCPHLCHLCVPVSRAAALMVIVMLIRPHSLVQPDSLTIWASSPVFSQNSALVCSLW